MAIIAVVGLHVVLPARYRVQPVWVIPVVLLVLLAVLIAGDPGRIDRQKTWLRVLMGIVVAVITVANLLAAVRLVVDILTNSKLYATNPAGELAAGGVIWATNVIAFGLWYWDLDRGGAAARAHHPDRNPAFVFAEPVTKLQADQGQGDTDRADDDRGNGEVDVVGAQDEADREVVDAQRDPGDQQLPGPLLGRFDRGLVMVARAAADGLQHRVAAGGDQQCGADPVGGAAERVSEAVAQQETQERHPGLEYPEDEANPQPGASIDTCHPDADRDSEVRQPEREGNQ